MNKKRRTEPAQKAQYDSYELTDNEIEEVTGGRVGRVGATTVSSCPVCGTQEKSFSVLSVSELKYLCPCGAVLQYDKVTCRFCEIA